MEAALSRTRVVFGLSCGFVIALPCAAQSTTDTAPRTHGGHAVVPLSENGKIKARDLPYEIVSGDPSKAGAPFAIRIHNSDNQVAPPHWHPEDEHIVVVRGKWFLGTGDKFDRTALRPLAVGDYVMMPKSMHHFAWSDGETVVQIHGIGPFKVNLSSKWMFLSDPAAANQFKFRLGQQVRSKRGDGVVRFGARSDHDRVTQYGIETASGTAHYAFEDEIESAR
jgi:hypothetical protein